jgi:tetratricopeptide (TPR) repeat protein
MSIGFLAREYGDFERARAPLTEALPRFAALNDREGQAWTLSNLGLLHAGEGRLAEAQRCQEQSLALYREVGVSAQVAVAFNHLGNLAAQTGDFTAASRWHEESLALARQLGSRFRIMRQLYLLGSMARLLGEHARARQLFVEATTLMRSGDPFAWVWQWTYPADLATDEGAYEQAGELYNRALQHYQRLGWQPGISHIVQRLGILAIRTGNERQGVRLVAATHAIGAGIVHVHLPEVAHERRAALEQARAVLGEAAYQAAWAAGQALALEEAIAEAYPEEKAEEGGRPATL